ncbi:MAG: hypothetical protein IJ358_03100 [Clostridia bacterium]|nr:hypothetical protein [Clostridia bacterium]
MEQQYGLTAEQLDEIFTHVKATKHHQYGDEIYKAYLPAINVYANTYGLTHEQVRDIYSEVVAFIYDKIIKDIIQPADFNICFTNIMKRQCAACNTKGEMEEKQFQSGMLRISYANNISTSNLNNETNGYNRQRLMAYSLLYTLNLFNELKNNPKLADQYHLDATRISMVQDLYGINAEGRTYSVAEIVQKYNISERMAGVMLAMAVKNIRHIKEFDKVVKYLK